MAADLINATATIVGGYLAGNPTPLPDIPRIIDLVHRALSDRDKRPDLSPAVPIDQSVHDDYIVCLEDGQRTVVLKRHLKHRFGMTPEAYRDKWGLPAEYPMTAPSYSRSRSQMAKTNGLGVRT